jgi:hypothetical protein
MLWTMPNDCRHEPGGGRAHDDDGAAVVRAQVRVVLDRGLAGLLVLTWARADIEGLGDGRAEEHPKAREDHVLAWSWPEIIRTRPERSRTCHVGDRPCSRAPSEVLSSSGHQQTMGSQAGHLTSWIDRRQYRPITSRAGSTLRSASFRFVTRNWRGTREYGRGLAQQEKGPYNGLCVRPTWSMQEGRRNANDAATQALKLSAGP